MFDLKIISIDWDCLTSFCVNPLIRKNLVIKWLQLSSLYADRISQMTATDSVKFIWSWWTFVHFANTQIENFSRGGSKLKEAQCQLLITLVVPPEDGSVWIYSFGFSSCSIVLSAVSFLELRIEMKVRDLIIAALIVCKFQRGKLFVKILLTMSAFFRWL